MLKGIRENFIFCESFTWFSRGFSFGRLPIRRGLDGLGKFCAAHGLDLPNGQALPAIGQGRISGDLSQRGLGGRLYRRRPGLNHVADVVQCGTIPDFRGHELRVRNPLRQRLHLF